MSRIRFLPELLMSRNSPIPIPFFLQCTSAISEIEKNSKTRSVNKRKKQMKMSQFQKILKDLCPLLLFVKSLPMYTLYDLQLILVCLWRAWKVFLLLHYKSESMIQHERKDTQAGMTVFFCTSAI